VATAVCEVVSVQNAYNFARRDSEDVLEACAQQDLAFIAHSPNLLGPALPYGATGSMERQPTPAETLATEIGAAHGVTAQQVAVAWLFARSPVVPIPGTSQATHADYNVAAGWLQLSADEIDRLGAVDARM
jgi:pyridoxine 4-dehydrogenase